MAPPFNYATVSDPTVFLNRGGCLQGRRRKNMMITSMTILSLEETSFAKTSPHIPVEVSLIRIGYCDHMEAAREVGKMGAGLRY